MPSILFSTLLLFQIPDGVPVEPQHDAIFFRFAGADVSLAVLDTDDSAAEIAAVEAATADGAAASSLERSVILGYDVAEIGRMRDGGADLRLFFGLGGETLVVGIAAAPEPTGPADPGPEASVPASPTDRVAAARARLRDILKPGDAAGTIADGVTVYLDDFLLNDAALMFAGHLPTGPTIRIEPEE
ncbi:MAG: hypothetical protein AAF371_08125 [Pseudomonadota bacterium]